MSVLKVGCLTGLMHGNCFVQAEDVIRDLVRSRGLGDVYKRQVAEVSLATTESVKNRDGKREDRTEWHNLVTVSYTHLTLPTIYTV